MHQNPILTEIPKRLPKSGVSFFRDARHFQILYLGLFLIFGILFLGWHHNFAGFATIFSTAIGVQLLGIRWVKLPRSSIKSALITSLGLCLLLKANHLGVLALATALAIGSKFLLRTKGKHIFNPANFGIIAAILLTGEAWVSPGQWGSSALLVYFVGAAGFMVLFKVGRIDLPLVFFLAFAGLEFCRTVLYLDWGADVWLHKLCNGSLLLFAFFMITDPRTAPNAQRARIIWALGIAVLTFLASNFIYLHTAPLWVLFCAAPATVLLDHIWGGEPFQWLEPRSRHERRPMRHVEVLPEKIYRKQ